MDLLRALASLGALAAVWLAAWSGLSWSRRGAAAAALADRIEPYRVERPAAGREEGRADAQATRLGTLGAELRRRLPSRYLDELSHNLVLAGRTAPTDLDKVLRGRLAAVALVPLWIVLGVLLQPALGTIGWALAGFGMLVSVLGGNAALKRQVAARQLAINRSLPDFLDLLTISVEAGLGFEQALERVVSFLEGPLAEECQRMLGEARAGATRAVAMRSLSERVEAPEFRSFVLAVIQAERLGSSIGTVLRTQSEEMRVKRQQRSQERAMKAPVKMLVPIVFCIFPALFVVVIGPAILKIRLAP